MNEESVQVPIVEENNDADTVPEMETLDVKKMAHRDAGKQKVKALLAEKDNEIKQLNEQILRRRAEFENFKRRIEQEKMDTMQYAGEKMLKELLPILDSFDRALEHQSETEESKRIYDGFVLIHKQLKDMISRSGVVEIQALGQPFDPKLHQAVGQEIVAGAVSGNVIKEYQKGYKLNSRLLRSAMVIVAE